MAILGYLDDPSLPPARPAFEEHLDLCQSTMTYLNAAVWDETRTSTCSSPVPMIVTGSPACPTTARSLGPYRNRESVGLFD